MPPRRSGICGKLTSDLPSTRLRVGGERGGGASLAGHEPQSERDRGREGGRERERERERESERESVFVCVRARERGAYAGVAAVATVGDRRTLSEGW